jgi:hypothetical protein
LTRLTLVRFTPDSDQTADIEQVAEGPTEDIHRSINQFASAWLQEDEVELVRPAFAAL